MRTTVDLDQDILQVAKSLARDQDTSIGRVLSDLARRGLTVSASPAVKVRNGIPLLPRRGKPVTTEIVHTLLEAED